MTLTNEQAEAYGKRWMAKAGWADGMLMLPHPAFGGRHRVQVDARGAFIPTAVPHDVPGDALPDLRDGATKGAALEVVRERWGIKRLWAEFQADNAMWGVGDWVLGWACLDGEKPPPDLSADSEEELLVAALEAAPPVKP